MLKTCHTDFFLMLKKKNKYDGTSEGVEWDLIRFFCAEFC